MDAGALIVANLDSAALAIGTLGTAVWAPNKSFSKYAAPLWFVSSVFWLLYAWLNSMPVLGAREVVSISLYGFGILSRFFWRKERRARER